MNTKMPDIGSKPQGNIPALVWNDNYWLAYGGQKTIPTTPILSKSQDGDSWTPITQTLFDTVEGAVWSGSQWLFYGTDASENIVFATATNNLTLTQITSPFVSQYDVCSGIGYDSANSWFYAYGFVSSKSTLVVFSGSWSTKLSTTGPAITQVNIISSTKYLALSSGLKVTSTIQNNSPTWESITYSNDTAINDILTRAITLKLNSNTWIVEGTETIGGIKSYVVSNDQGSTWSLHSQFYSTLKRLTWNGSYWLDAVNTSAPTQGQASKYSLVKSTDGITWSTSTVPLPDSLSSLYLFIYINSFWLIALKNGPGQRPSKNGPPILLTPPAHVILKSTDGLAYTNVNSPFDNTLGITYLAWNGSYLLAYGQSAATGNAYFTGLC